MDFCYIAALQELLRACKWECFGLGSELFPMAPVLDTQETLTQLLMGNRCCKSIRPWMFLTFWFPKRNFSLLLSSSKLESNGVWMEVVLLCNSLPGLESRAACNAMIIWWQCERSEK